MKYFYFLAAMAVLNFGLLTDAFAQQDTTSMNDDDLLKGFEYEQVHSDTPSKYYQVIGLGYTGTMFFNKVDDFNKILSTNFEMSELKMPLFMNGIGAYLALDPTKNFCLGFNYSSGYQKIEKALAGDLANYSRFMNYRVSFTNFELDYAIMPFRDFAILIGSSIGLSNIKIENFQGKTEYDFNQFLTNNDEKTKYQKIDGSFYYVEPHLAVEYKLSSYVMIKASGGYSFSFSPSWEINGESVVNNVPTTLKPEGMVVQAGIYLGIFDF